MKAQFIYESEDNVYVEVEYTDSGYVKIQYKQMISEDDSELVEGRMIDEYFLRKYIGHQMALSVEDISENLEINWIKPVKNTYSNEEWIVETNFGNIKMTIGEFEKVFDMSKGKAK